MFIKVLTYLLTYKLADKTFSNSESNSDKKCQVRQTFRNGQIFFSVINFIYEENSKNITTLIILRVLRNRHKKLLKIK